MDGVILVSSIVALFATASAVYFHFYFKKRDREAHKKV